MGVLLALTPLSIVDPSGRASLISSLLILVGFLSATVGADFYMLGGEPSPYSPNPYDNRWLRLVIESSLALIGIRVMLGYYVVVKKSR